MSNSFATPWGCPGFSVHGISQTRILEQVAISFSRSLPNPGIEPGSPFDCVDHQLWKILQEMGIPDHLTCLLRNLHAGQEATVRTGLGTMDWFQIGKGVHQGCILSPCLFNLYAEYSIVGWMKHKLESRLPGEI